MPERVRRHFRLSVAFTAVAIVLTELTHHYFAVEDTISAGLFLLGLVPIAYGALGAGFWAGAFSSLLLAAYVLHYTGEHSAWFTLSPEAGMAFGVILGLGLAMSWPMSSIHARELRFREEIRERASALERRNEELIESNAALEAFGFVVSHDLKEPVRAIENYLHAAREEWGSKDARQFVDEAYEANLRLAKMLEGLLSYSRASSSQPVPRPLDVSAIVQSDACRAQYDRVFEERNATLDVAPGIAPVQGDEVLLSQLLGNLLLNAVRHNPDDKPRVSITQGASPPGRVHLVVADNGPGFPADVLARFADVQTSHQASVKGGFGLVIAQRAARRLGGRLWLEDPPGGGAQAHVELPAAEPVAA